MADRRLAFSPREAAQLLGVSEKWVRAYVKRGDLPAVRIGRRILIPADVLDRLLAASAGDRG